MLASDLLDRAAVILVEVGHCKGKNRDSRGRACIGGAILRARLEMGYRDDAIWLAAIKAVRTAIGGDWYSISDWNDRDETTEADAVDVLQRAAIIAKEAGE